jgi:hypothetical protein
MSLFIAVFIVMSLVIFSMSIGVLMGRKPISGSCGGISALGISASCEICGGDRKKCEVKSQLDQFLDEDLSYDATKKD